MERVKVLAEIFGGKTEFSLKHMEIVKDIMFIKETGKARLHTCILKNMII